MKKQIVKLKELLEMDIDIDIYEENSGLEIAFCGPVKLTKKGKQRYKSILDVDVQINTFNNDYEYDIKTADILLSEDEKALSNLIYDFFYSVAGWCPASDFDAWFILE